MEVFRAPPRTPQFNVEAKLKKIAPHDTLHSTLNWGCGGDGFLNFCFDLLGSYSINTFHLPYENIFSFNFLVHSWLLPPPTLPNFLARLPVKFVHLPGGLVRCCWSLFSTAVNPFVHSPGRKWTGKPAFVMTPSTKALDPDCSSCFQNVENGKQNVRRVVSGRT